MVNRTLEKAQELGPVQVLVVVFDELERMSGAVLEELKRLREHDVVRLVDLLVVRRDEDGELEVVQRSDLTADEASAFGAIVGPLLGVESEEGELAEADVQVEGGHVFGEADVWYLADAVPKGTAAAVALLEHRWAMPLAKRILEAGGSVVVDEWIHPADLAAASST